MVIQAEADASAPINHGINLGTLSGRNSYMDKASNHQMIISQMMTEPKFTDDFVLVTAEGTEVRMDAVGNVTYAHSGEVEDGLTAQNIGVDRKVSVINGQYKVDYVITNNGIQERGIPGVRIATVEGYIIETDAYGRFHLNAIDVADFARGQNFIMKIDTSTVPQGAQFTTENPRVKRITQGLPTRFDFGVKIPEPKAQSTQSEGVDIELGTLFFDDNSARIKPEFEPLLLQMAETIDKHQGGTLVFDGHGGGLGIAFDRATVVRDALLALVNPELHEKLEVSIIASPELEIDDREIITIGDRVKLGSIFFDLDKDNVKADYWDLIKSIATYINENGGGAIMLSGHTDIRADNDYNYQLGLRRAKNVYEDLMKYIDKSKVDEVRVETSSREYKTIEGGAL